MSKEFILKSINKRRNHLIEIIPGGSQPARIYGTPKIHKLKSLTDTLTFPPIVSSIGTYNNNLEKFFTDMLDPVIPRAYWAKDSFSFY